MLKYKIEKINERYVLEMEGQVSVNERNKLREILDNDNNTAQKYYFIDLSRVFYIDSYGISFIQSLILNKGQKRILIIINDKDYIDYIFRFSKIDQLSNIKFYKTIKEALERLA